MNSFWSRLTNRLVMCPSRDTIQSAGKQRIEIPLSEGFVEAWVEQFPTETTAAATRLIIVKFPGAAGRAERANIHPAEIISAAQTEIWAINPCGYGGSSGQASLKSFPLMADAVMEVVRQRFPQSKIMVMGTSLGGLSALYIASRHPVHGLLLRNPVPLHQLILNRPRYNWWSFGLTAWIAAEIPNELDALQNAPMITAPGLFVQSARDRVVPPKFQNWIIDRYAGRKQVFSIPAADHHEPILEAQRDDYAAAIRWLADEMNVNQA